MIGFPIESAQPKMGAQAFSSYLLPNSALSQMRGHKYSKIFEKVDLEYLELYLFPFTDCFSVYPFIRKVDIQLFSKTYITEE